MIISSPRSTEGRGLKATLSRAVREAAGKSSNALLRDEERQIIEMALAKGLVSEEQTGALVRSVLKHRHTKETQDLAVACAKETASKFLPGLKRLDARQEKERYCNSYIPTQSFVVCAKSSCVRYMRVL